MIFEARSHIEQPARPQTDDELAALRHVQQWEQEDEFDPSTVIRFLDDQHGTSLGWSMTSIDEQAVAGDAFAKLCNNDGLGELDQSILFCLC